VTSPPDADNVGEHLISSRSFQEYEAMFMLADGDFRGRLLDCPGGASSFTLQASDRGALVTAVVSQHPQTASSDSICFRPRTQR
jgi:hypothetical protein